MSGVKRIIESINDTRLELRGEVEILRNTVVKCFDGADESLDGMDRKIDSILTNLGI